MGFTVSGILLYLADNILSKKLIVDLLQELKNTWLSAASGNGIQADK